MVLLTLASLAFVLASLNRNPFGSREGTFTRLEAEPISAAPSAPLSASTSALEQHWTARIEQALSSTSGSSPATALHLRREVFGRPRNVSLQAWRFVAQRFAAYFGDVSAQKQLTLFLHFSKAGGTLLLRQYNALDADLFVHARAIFAADQRYLMALRDGHSVEGLHKNCVCSARSQ